MADTERLLNRDEVAERLGLSRLTVGAMMRDGRLPAFHLGRLWKMREEDLNEYVRKLAAEGERERAARAAKREGARKLAARQKAERAAKAAGKAATGGEP